MTGERRQTRLLTRTFFARLFESELIPPGVAQVRVVTSVLAFLAGPSLVLPLFLMKKYVAAPAAVARVGLAQDRTMALLLSMTAAAVISLVIWENMFPDRRDSRMLGVLPVRTRSFVVSRLLAIVGLFSLLFLAPAAIASVSFGILGLMTGLAEGFWRIAMAHFLATASAEAFIFFAIVAVQCALMSAAGPAAAHRLAVVLQMAIIVAVLQMPMVLPGGETFKLDQAGVPLWIDTVSASLLPPLWFLSLYESLAAGGYEGTTHLARAAALLGLLTPVAALGFYAASYRRLTRLAVEGRPTPRRATVPWPGRVVAAVSRSVSAAVEGAAVCAFTLRTITRSRQHRMLLAVWIGVAVALTISAPLPLLIRSGWSGLDQPTESLLVGPFIFAALVQTGMRTLFAISVEIRANWVIRLCEPARLRETLGGAAAAMIALGVVPPALIALVSATWLWGPSIGVMHGAFCAAVGLVLVQALTYAIDKIPFTCTYSPGNAKIGSFWPVYLVAFTTFTYGMAGLETALLRTPRTLFVAVAVLAALSGVLWWLRMRRSAELDGLCFEAQPDDALTVVSL